jgi:adenylate/guanylate cyclase family protein
LKRSGILRLGLKIGIHEGPCLAVVLNERQDYFGQTVNIASRVQSVAESRAIFVTQPVVAQSAKVLEAHGLQPARHDHMLRGPRQRGDDLRDRLKLVAVDVAGNAVPAEKMILEEIVIEFAWRGPSAVERPATCRGRWGTSSCAVQYRVRIRWPDRVAYGLTHVCPERTARSRDSPIGFRGMKPELDGKAGPHGEPSQS